MGFFRWARLADPRRWHLGRHFFPDATPEIVELMQAQDSGIEMPRAAEDGQETPQPWNLCPPAEAYRECDFSNAAPAEPLKEGAGEG